MKLVFKWNLILGNEKNESLFIELVKQIGEGKWSEIARGLQIHGINVTKPNQLHYLWKKLNPENQKLKINQITDIVKYAVQAKGNYGNFVSQWFKVHGKTHYQDDYKLINHCQSQIKRILIKLILMFCRKKQGTRKLVWPVRQQSMMKFIAMADCQSQTPFMVLLNKVSIRLGELLVRYVDHYFLVRGELYAKLAEVVTKRQMDEIVQFILLFDDITKIRDRTYKVDDDLISKSKYLAKTLKENQESELYRYLYPDLNFVQYYNESKQTMNSDYILDLEINKYIKNFQAAPPTFIEVQKNKMKTVRGRISKDNKQVYRSIQCDKFEKELLDNLDDDYESDSDIQLQVNQFLKHSNRPTDEQINNAIMNSQVMQDKVNELIRQLKYQTYMEYLTEQEKKQN